MKKIVKIKESELVNLIDRIITETTRKQKISETIRNKKVTKEESEKYSYESKKVRGIEYLFAYPDKSGVETKNSLEKWETEDSSNRELQFVSSKKEAVSSLKSFN